MMEQYKIRPDDFYREVLEFGDHKNIVALEAKMLYDVDAKNNMDYYNQHNGDGDFYNKGGYKLSQETRLAMSIQRKGRIFTPEWKEKLSKAKQGSNHPLFGIGHKDEAKLKISLANRGRKRSKDHIQKMVDGRKRARKLKELNNEEPSGNTSTDSATPGRPEIE